MKKQHKKQQEIKINPEFRDLIPAPSKRELQCLEDSLLDHGLLEPLVLWNGTLLDGHYRHMLCEVHGIGIKTVDIYFPNELSAKRWKIESELNRRKLTTFSRGAMALQLRDLKPEGAGIVRTKNGYRKKYGEESTHE